MNIWNQLPRHFLCLAPMEGVTDIVFRQVVATAGRPDLFFTEFTNVSSYASDKGRANALERLQVSPSDKPIIAQIWGKNPEHFAAVANALGDLGFSGIDLNMGCPDRHVNRAGGGAAMIRTPELAVECIRSAYQNAANLPVSVKTRLGYTSVDEWRNWLTLLLGQNLAALTVHLRTRKEMSKVPAHYELIPEIIALRNQIAPNTKLIINGDVKDRAHADELWAKYPEADGMMIGRGIFANPYCFTTHQPTREELLNLLKLHLELFDEWASKGKFTEHCDEPAVISTNAHGKNSVGSPACQVRSEFLPTERCQNDDCARSSSVKFPLLAPSFEPLKHYFKIYVNNFPGASDFRAALMNCHNTTEARAVIADFEKLF